MSDPTHPNPSVDGDASAPGAAWSPMPMFASAPPQPTHRHARLMALGAVVAVVVIAIGVAVAVRGATSGPTYRTAVVARRSVAQVLDGVGTFEPTSQASVAFPVAGTVSDVRVAVGDTVAVGDPLASLDETSLQRSLHTAQAGAATASLNLQRALAGETVGTAGNGSAGGAPATNRATTASTSAAAAPVSFSTASEAGSDAGTTPGSRPSTGSGDALTAAPHEVLTAQRTVDAKLGAADAALAAAQQVCGTLPGGTSTPTPTSTTSTTSVPATPPTVSSDDVTSCEQALQAVLRAQRDVARAQRALSAAADRLDAMLAERTATFGGSATTQGTASDGPSTRTSGGSPSSATGQAGTSTTRLPSSAKLIAYQKAVDAADAAVTAAQQALAQSTIVSPIAGTVAEVSLVKGGAVTAASTTAMVLVVGGGGYEATTMVPVAEVPHVKVGQIATVTPDGSHVARTGRVVAIGLAGTTSASGATTYPVTIGLGGDTADLGNGSTAQVAIRTDSVAAAVAVPTSAVTTQGSRHTVTVLAHGAASTVAVGVGAVGGTWTAITSGLDVGQVVVLADLSTPLPGTATASSSSGRSGTDQRQGPFAVGRFGGIGGNRRGG
jgi:HlyD family secretion protein